MKRFFNNRNVFVDPSGRRDLNPRPQPWQGCALPLSYTRIPFTVRAVEISVKVLLLGELNPIPDREKM